MTKEKGFLMVKGLENAEEITNFRQTDSCFNAHEVNPAIGCDFLCRYCSMYGQEDVENHLPMKIYQNYPAYLVWDGRLWQVKTASKNRLSCLLYSA